MSETSTPSLHSQEDAFRCGEVRAAERRQRNEKRPKGTHLKRSLQMSLERMRDESLFHPSSFILPTDSFIIIYKQFKFTLVLSLPKSSLCLNRRNTKPKKKISVL
jgi:hypothetical protein